jgi:hypothetical protein
VYLLITVETNEKSSAEAAKTAIRQLTNNSCSFCNTGLVLPFCTTNDVEAEKDIRER